MSTLPCSTQRTTSPRPQHSLREAGTSQKYEGLQGPPKTAHTRSVSDRSKQPGVLYKAKVTLYFTDNLEPTSLEIINQLALGNSTFNVTLAISGIPNLLSFSEMNVLPLFS